MSDEPTQIPADAPAPEARVEAPPPAVEPEASSSPLPDAAVETVDAHPEYIVAGAFVGSFLLAKILRRLGGGE